MRASHPTKASRQWTREPVWPPAWQPAEQLEVERVLVALERAASRDWRHPLSGAVETEGVVQPRRNPHLPFPSRPACSLPSQVEAEWLVPIHSPRLPSVGTMSLQSRVQAAAMVRLAFRPMRLELNSEAEAAPVQRDVHRLPPLNRPFP